MQTTLRSDRRKNPEPVQYRLLSFDECKALTGHCDILDQHGKLARVLITSVRTWKTRPDEIEVRYKFGLYEYGHLSIVRDIADNDILVKVLS